MARKPRTPFNLDSFSGAFRTESDRACAVLGAALLDSKLESLYARRLRSHHEELLPSSRPLGSFAARIRVAQSLAWISTDVASDLDQVRSIRNEFAHNADHELSFGDQSISDKCATLKVAQILVEANEYAASQPHPNLSAAAIRAMGSIYRGARQQFEITVEMLAQHIDDLPADASPYAGPNLRDDLWALASHVRVTISAVGTVSPPPRDDSPRGSRGDA
jgi:DNA-binding MltR family transcriptional regulator